MTAYAVFASNVSQADAHSQCVAALGQVNAGLGLPSKDGLTLTHSVPYDHPDIHVYETAMLVTDAALPFLPQNQVFLTPDQMQAAGWQLYQGPGFR